MLRNAYILGTEFAVRFMVAVMLLLLLKAILTLITIL